MCYYRYYYYLGCRHQETALYDFCANAQPVSHQKVPDGEIISGRSEGVEDEMMSTLAEGVDRLRVANGEGMAGMDDIDDLPFAPLTSINISSHQRNSSIDIGSRSIIAEPGIDYAYSQPAVQPAYHPSPPSDDFPQNMAGLPLFGLRQWMTGGATTTPPQSASKSNADNGSLLEQTPSASQSGTTRSRQAGIRENTDESCDLPKSNDILQHIAEYHRSLDQRTRHAPGHHVPSYGATSTIHALATEPEIPEHAYDNIEAEIDILKEEVLKLRQEAEKSRPAPKTEQNLATDRFLSTRSRDYKAAEPVHESAATRLQKLHELQSEIDARQSSLKAAANPSVPQAPVPIDFPALTQPAAVSTMPLTCTGQSNRKPSYAHAASNGMMDAISHTFQTTPNNKTVGSTSSGPPTSDSIAGSSDVYRTPTNSSEATGYAQDEVTTVTTHSRDVLASSPADVFNTNASPHSSPNGKTKGVPRFAQPTKSFARRAGETLRKDSTASLSSRSPRDGSPSKNAKENDITSLATKRTAHPQQKRKSLPGEWTNVSNQPAELKSRQTQTMIPVAKKHIKGKEKQTPPLHREKNAYMAPTVAATQRNTIILQPYKTQLEQYKKPNEVHLDRVPPTMQSPSPSRANTSASEDSSVCFVTDRSTAFGNDPYAALIGEIAQCPAAMTDASQRYVEGYVAHQMRPESALNPTTAISHSARPGASRLPQLPSQAMARYESIGSEGVSVISRVHNATIKRRTSHGNLLTPIVARLQAQGLLKRDASHNASVGTSLTGVSTQLNSHAAIPPPGSPSRRSEARSDGSSVVTGTPVWRAMPPHLRRLLNASPNAQPSVYPSYRDALQSTTKPHGISNDHQFCGKGRRDTVMSGTNTSAVQGSALTPTTTSVPSLRATAEVFEPTKVHGETVTVGEDNLPTGYISDDVWYQLNPQLREKILNLRAARSVRPWYTLPNNRAPPHGTSPLHEDFFNNGAANPQFAAQQDRTPSSVQAGQILTPTLSPGKKNVHWMLKDTNGGETPVGFGRAPPPGLSSFYGPSTPAMSSTSGNSSPLKTPSSTDGWRIGSTYATRPFGWKGGDGKEISFVGYGPHAERDPNTIVGFDFRGKMSNYSAGTSNGFCEDGENEIPVPFVAPRSQRQWAEKLGYAKVPCGNVEVTHAVEQMPFASQLAGYCYDCAGR